MTIPEVKPLPHKAILQKHGIKLGQAALYTGLTYSFLCNTLNGNNRPSKKTLEKLDALVKELESRKGGK